MNSEERVRRLVTGSGGVVPVIRTADPINLMHDVMLMSIGVWCIKQHTIIKWNGASK